MDALTIVLIAVVLIIVLLAIFTFLTYIFLSIFRRPSAGETARALKEQQKKKGK